MAGRLDGKVALGATVILTDVLVSEGRSVADEIGGQFYEHDVRDAETWASIVKQALADHNKIDVLINNAGIFRIGGLAETDTTLWDDTIGINQTGVFLGMQTVAPAMTENQSGSIINVSSIAGLRGAGIAIAYAATKWAVRGMTKSAAQELASSGVRVNSIHPGIIETPMLNAFSDAGIREQTVERIPIGRVAEASDVANLALFLASDESSYCTGSEFVIDGGYTA